MLTNFTQIIAILGYIILNPSPLFVQPVPPSGHYSVCSDNNTVTSSLFQSCSKMNINTYIHENLTCSMNIDMKMLRCLYYSLPQELSSCGCSGPVLTRPQPSQASLSSPLSSTPTSPWLPACSLLTPSPALLSTEENWTWSDNFQSIAKLKVHMVFLKHMSDFIYIYFYRCIFRMPPWLVVLRWEHVLI